MNTRRRMGSRLGQTGITLFIVVTFNFWLFRLLPGNFTQLLSRAGALDKAAVASLKQSFGLDKSPIEQYVLYLKNLVTFNWGTSYVSHQPVIQMVLQALINTLVLITVAYLLTVLIGVALGVFAGKRAGRLAELDHHHELAGTLEHAYLLARARPGVHLQCLVRRIACVGDDHVRRDLQHTV